MSEKSKSSGMKSAYELALERLENEGIERPREEAFDDETLARISEVRSKAEARLAELKILFEDKIKHLYDPHARAEEEEKYHLDRRRVEQERDRKLEEIRQGHR